MITPMPMMNGMYNAMPYGYGAGYGGYGAGGYGGMYGYGGYGMAPVDPVAQKFTQETGKTNPNFSWAMPNDAARDVAALEGEAKGAQWGGAAGALLGPAALALSPLAMGVAPVLIAAGAGIGVGVLAGSQLGKWIGKAKFTLDDVLDNGVVDSSPRSRETYERYQEVAQEYQKHQPTQKPEGNSGHTT